MKKLLSVCLVLSMLLALVACGGDTPASTASGASPASGSGTSAEPSGKLVIYSPNSDTQVASSLTNGFMVKYPAGRYQRGRHQLQLLSSAPRPVGAVCFAQ